METLKTDLLVVGGGINGVGVAVDASGRGLSVILCEKDDLANHTSSHSSKLIHGGLRYLEQIELKLVREALEEREILMRKAPYLVRPVEFVLPYDKHLRPQWMIRVGLFLYDYLARRESLKGAQKINLQKALAGRPLKNKFKVGFRYADCQTDDARLVIVNALDAQSHGAKIWTRTECQSVTRENDHWRVRLYCKNTGKQKIVYAKALVNATGPWVSEFLHDVATLKTRAQVRLIKGSHFTVPKLYKGRHAYILQNPDKRVVFTIRQNDRVVGSTSYYEISQQHKRLTIGYTWYGPEHWGTSINPTAKLLLMQHAFEQCDFNRVAFCIDAQNTRSLRAVAKLGAQQEGTLHQHIIRADGSIRDSVIYAITHTDWPGIKGRLLSRISL